MTFGRYLLVVFCIPWLLTVSLPLLLLARVTGFVREISWHPSVVFIGHISVGGGRLWAHSTTIGRVIFLHPDAAPWIFPHELVHVRQHEDLTFFAWHLSVFLGPLIPWWASLLLWWSAGLWQLWFYLTATCRYGFNDRAYRDAEHERAAYAQTSPTIIEGERKNSWLEWREHQAQSQP